MIQYPFGEIEPRWQASWAEARAFHADPIPGKPKWFVNELAPFANGRLHLGHVRNYTLADALARFRRQIGFNVLYTSAFDAFGLPNDIAARAEGCHPEELARRNIREMSALFVRLGLSHDTRRILGYHEPRFYRWVQHVFVALANRGQIVRRERRVSYCPRCETTVEEGLVDEAGRCWRCASEVEGRRMAQWFADEGPVFEEVLAGLERLDGWPARVKTIQARMIGRREGVRVLARLADADVPPLSVFLDAPELVPGIAFFGVGPRHALVEHLRGKGRIDAAAEARIQAILAEPRNQESREDRRQKYVDAAAVPLGVTALHPLDERPLPVAVVGSLDPFADDAAMAGVPAHRRIDLRLAQQIGVAPRPVLKPPGGAGAPAEIFEWDEGFVLAGDARLAGKTVAEARPAIAGDLDARGAGGPATDLRIGPWHLSRQRYWGTPIPIVFCPSCGPVPVPEGELPVELPMDVDLDAPGNALTRHRGFLDAACPRCHGPGRRESDTLDVYFPAWWFLWACKGIEHPSPFESEDARHWMPVDQMIGGVEQSTTCFLHLRALSRMMVQAGLSEWEEPVTGLLAIGMVKRDGEKMSKSRGNAEDAGALIERFGADALRFGVLSVAAPENDFNWTEEIPRRAQDFLNQVFQFFQDRSRTLRFDALDASLSIDAGRPARRQLATWVAAAIERTTNNMLRGDLHLVGKNLTLLFESLVKFEEKTVERHGELDTLDLRARALAGRAFLVMLAPLAPHLAEELWHSAGGTGHVSLASWPGEVHHPPPRARRPKASGLE